MKHIPDSPEPLSSNEIAREGLLEVKGSAF